MNLKKPKPDPDLRPEFGFVLNSEFLPFGFTKRLHFSVYSMFVGVSLSVFAVEMIVGVEVMEVENGLVWRDEVSGILFLFLCELDSK